jgi:polysaccharide export outer membrane protein
MKIKTHILLAAALCLAASWSLQAQEQGQGQGQSQGVAQGVSVVSASSIDSQGIKKYLLGPGDTLDIRVFGQPDLNWQGEVEADGNITSLPFIEAPIRAQCRTDKEVQKDIIAAYSKFLKSPQISVRLTGRNSRPPATILGAVLAPTRVQMQRRVRLNELIAASGGYTERANGDIQILHTEPVMCPEPDEVVEPLLTNDGLGVNVIKTIKTSELLSGRTEANPVIRPGDIINVMEAKPVYITGVVTSPQAVLLRDGLTLTKALAMVGGVGATAKSSDIRIYRNKIGASEQEIVRVDLDAIKKKKKEDILLQAYDVIEVPKTSDWNPRIFLTNLARTFVGGISNAPAQAISYRVMY